MATPTAPIQLVWFKRDLRVRDHAPLVEAAARGSVLPLYVYEPEVVGHAEFHPSHLEIINDGLRELDLNLRALGTPLVFRTGDMVQVLDTIHRSHPFTALWSHEETGNWATFQRDKRVRAWCQDKGIPWLEIPQNGVVRRLKSRDGWAAEWEARMAAPLAPAAGQLTPVRGLDPQGLRTHADLGLPPNDKTIQRGGEKNAHQTLDSFLAVRGVNYMREMSSPLTGEVACSRLSIHLAFGTISMKQVVAASRQRLAAVKGDIASGQYGADPRWVRSLRSFESRLHWHCHFMQRLESEPGLEFHNLNRAMDGLRENDFDQVKFDAWAHGQTGFPMVDACMRALRATGWLNFRMRAMLVSFASQHLWLHWRQTGLHLGKHWLDNEAGIHWSQMQMQASTVGINAVRIYSPTKQARDQDPEGVFIRRWVPELARVPGGFVFEPWTLPDELQAAAGVRIGHDYPAPIVNEVQAARQAKARIYAARKTPEALAEAGRIYEKHGSRKLPNRRRPTPPRRKPMSENQPSLFGAPEDSAPAAPIAVPDLPESWMTAIGGEFQKPYFRDLMAFVTQERATATVFPPEEDVFNALRLTPLDQVRVFILGQDPYHGPGQAHGLSFSVRPGVRPPPSLQNIYRELQTDVGFKIPRHGHLAHWAQGGVLLLNAVLTVRQAEPNSHAGKGWEKFTDAVIAAVNAKSERVVFILWGAYARKKVKLITGPQHVILESAHPSPLSVTKFLGSRPFSQANAALKEAGQPEVDWQLPFKAEVVG